MLRMLHEKYVHMYMLGETPSVKNDMIHEDTYCIQCYVVVKIY